MDQIQSVGQLLLQEFREFRAEMSEWRQETGERLAKLETQVKHGISGNGQPSRLSVVETRVDGLERWRWYVWGGGIAALGCIEFLLHAHIGVH